jgi:hypothetical protein
MRQTIAVLIAGVLLFGILGCGSNAKTNLTPIAKTVASNGDNPHEDPPGPYFQARR